MQGDNKLRILADENITGLEELCDTWALVKKMSGREITGNDLKGYDALFVRSVTQVTASLLEHSTVRFVGTATIGTEHIDTNYLSQQGIGFASAPGSNANAVVDYVMAATDFLLGAENLKNKVVGVVGVGNVGSRLCRCLSHFGIAYRVYDPYVTHLESANKVDFDTLLSSDIISVHVPLTQSGDYPTYQMFDAKALAAMPDNVLLINSSRGGVINERALQARLKAHPAMQLALDVWQGEPNISKQTMSLAAIATPHIAGYSVEGKRRGSYDIIRAAQNYFNISAPPLAEVISADKLKNYTALGSYMERNSARVNIKQLTDRFNQAMQGSSTERGKAFDAFRKAYPLRFETAY